MLIFLGENERKAPGCKSGRNSSGLGDLEIQMYMYVRADSRGQPRDLGADAGSVGAIPAGPRQGCRGLSGAVWGRLG